MKELMALPELGDFYLVGGTALALQIGHRNSIDLDLFCDLTWDPEAIIHVLPEPKEQTAATSVFQGYYVRNVKCDFVRYRYPRILPLIVDDGVRMADPLEIAAMKFMAITNRGRKKDFVDLYYLLEMYSMEEIFGLFEVKFPSVQQFLVVRSLCYFGDAEADPDPEMLEGVSWDQMKSEILERVRKFAS
ncbi:MAG: nucleotidyl transferase AbiEii/AbiGii toxin family protein [Bacteroidia bacterium]